MLKKIKRAFGFGSCDPMEGSTIIINAEKLERRVALLENGVLEEYTIEREGEDNIVGGIFKGRVKNIEPGLKAMFVDIGQEKNAFLHFWDALPAALDSSLEEIEREGRPKKQQRKSRPKTSRTSIPSALKSWCRSPKDRSAPRVPVSQRTYPWQDATWS